MAPLHGAAAAHLINLGKSIPAEDLAEKGIETDCHITAYYGLETSDHTAIENHIRGTKPFRIKISGLSYFSSPDCDVLYAKILSPGLRALHKKIDKMPNQKTHKLYQPHATIAYLKPGKAVHYVENLKKPEYDLTVSQLVFSTPDKKRAIIPLKRN